jgi:hypothetical protein
LTKIVVSGEEKNTGSQLFQQNEENKNGGRGVV